MMREPAVDSNLFNKSFSMKSDSSPGGNKSAQPHSKVLSVVTHPSRKMARLEIDVPEKVMVSVGRFLATKVP
jgi:hypothetical protein